MVPAPGHPFRAAVLAGALACVAAAPAIQAAPAALGPRIVQGRLTSAHAAAVALLHGPDRSSAAVACTGTLVGCSTVLTAAHCVCEGRGARCQGTDAPDPHAWHVFSQHAGFAGVERIAVHPDAEFPESDLAILHLAGPVSGVAPAALAGATPPPGAAGTIVGFGRAGGRLRDYGLKREGAVTLEACGAEVDAPGLCWRFGGTGSNTCEGDSGGPLFVEEGGAPVLAGVTGGGSRPDCLSGDLGFDTDVAAFRAWVLTQAGDAGGDGCPGLAAAGRDGTTVLGFDGSLDEGTPATFHALTIGPGTALLRVTMNASEQDGADFQLTVGRDAVSEGGDGAAGAGGPVKAGGGPVPGCLGEGSGRFAACMLEAPEPGPWWIAVRRRRGTGAYQATATSWAGGAPAALPGPRCEPGGVRVLRMRRGGRLRLDVRVRAGGDAALAAALAAHEILGVVVDDGRERLAFAVPSGDGGWRSTAAGGSWRWRGHATGMRRLRLRQRRHAGGDWLVGVRGARVAGLQAVDRAHARVEVWVGGRCLAE